MGATTRIPIDEFMAKGERDEKVILRYHNTESDQEKAIIAHEIFRNYLARLEKSKEPEEIVKVTFGRWGNPEWSCAH